MLNMLEIAARVALPSSYMNEKRNFVLGAAGKRRDGAIVSSRNGAVISSNFDEYRVIPEAHAEFRLLKKLGKADIIYVARVLKKDGNWAMARPCGSCRLRIKAAHIKKVCYTIDANHYGIWHVAEDVDRIYEI